MSAPKPSVIFVGITGAGKSTLIEKLSQGEVKDISSDQGEGFTTEVKPFDLESCIVFDTPGLGDSESRDQIFISKMVETLLAANTGIHRIYICFLMTEPRMNSMVQEAFNILNGMFDNPDSEYVRVVLTQADCVPTHQRTRRHNAHAQQFDRKCDIKDDQIIVVGDSNNGFADGIEQLNADIQSIDLKRFVQTDSMKTVQTLATRMRDSEAKIGELGDQMEQKKQAIDKLKQDLETADEEHKQAILQQKHAAELDKKTVESDMLKETIKLLQTEIEQLKVKFGAAQVKQMEYAISAAKTDAKLEANIAASKSNRALHKAAAEANQAMHEKALADTKELYQSQLEAAQSQLQSVSCFVDQTVNFTISGHKIVVSGNGKMLTSATVPMDFVIERSTWDGNDVKEYPYAIRQANSIRDYVFAGDNKGTMKCTGKDVGKWESFKIENLGGDEYKISCARDGKPWRWTGDRVKHDKKNTYDAVEINLS